MNGQKLVILFLFLNSLYLFATPALSLEYQWKFTVPAMDSREKAVQVYDLLRSIQGVFDVDINMETGSLMFFFDDEKTDETAAKKALEQAGFPVERMMLLQEPREGVMN